MNYDLSEKENLSPFEKMVEYCQAIGKELERLELIDKGLGGFGYPVPAAYEEEENEWFRTDDPEADTTAIYITDGYDGDFYLNPSKAIEILRNTEKAVFSDEDNSICIWRILEPADVKNDYL